MHTCRPRPKTTNHLARPNPRTRHLGTHQLPTTPRQHAHTRKMLQPHLAGAQTPACTAGHLRPSPSERCWGAGIRAPGHDDKVIGNLPHNRLPPCAPQNPPHSGLTTLRPTTEAAHPSVASRPRLQTDSGKKPQGSTAVATQSSWPLTQSGQLAIGGSQSGGGPSCSHDVSMRTIGLVWGSLPARNSILGQRDATLLCWQGPCCSPFLKGAEVPVYGDVSLSSQQVSSQRASSQRVSSQGVWCSGCLEVRMCSLQPVYCQNQ